jgi:hypothetical protein
MPTLTLGRNQTVSVAGVTTGVREIDVDISSKTHDVTSFDDPWETTLVLSRDIAVRLTALHKEVYDAVWPKYAQHPPQPFTISVGGLSMKVVATDIKMKSPVDGVVSWDMEFRAWSKQ